MEKIANYGDFFPLPNFLSLCVSVKREKCSIRHGARSIAALAGWYYWGIYQGSSSEKKVARKLPERFCVVVTAWWGDISQPILIEADIASCLSSRSFSSTQGAVVL